MFNIASLVVLTAQILRMIGAVAAVAAIGFGIYLLLNNSMLQGAMWIIGAVACGWVGNVVSNLVILLGSAAAGPFARR